jgi:hypothetical protein
MTETSAEEARVVNPVKLEAIAPGQGGIREASPRRGWSNEAAVRWMLGAVLIVASVLSASAQTQTVGLFINDERASEGLTLFEPKFNTTVHILNNDGLPVHTWEIFVRPASMGYLLPSGNLLRAANRGGAGSGLGLILREYDWDGNVVWEFTLDDSQFLQHHDIEPLPNGNVLFLAREIKTEAEAIAAGRNPLLITEGEVRPDTVVEVRPIPPNDGEIVWEWHVWDHLIQDFDAAKDNYGVVEDHPELFDINYGPPDADWTHFNGIDYNPDFDQIIVTGRKFGEVYIIDHSTTTEEAAGHSGGNSGMGGDILYRWGNPAAYRRGTAADQKLFGAHDGNWILPGYPGEGNILVFNNGWLRPVGFFSSVDEIVPPVDEFGVYSIDPGAPFGPDEPIWSYVSDPPEDFHSFAISGAERRPEGTTLICEGVKGHLFEVVEDGEIVWDYVNPIDSTGPVAQGYPVINDLDNRVFKIRRYPSDHPAFVGRDLTPGDPLELFTKPLPVPEGTLTAARATPSGDQIELEWDAATCTSYDYHLLFGPLASVSTYDLSGAECNIGTSGTHMWMNVPSGSLYFLIAGTDDFGVYESSWGRDSAGVFRNGTAASFQCGTTTKVVSSTCP